ncbi:MAG: hypothetical protein ACRD4R_06840 [Candidatus Acidiferrales bacterium]
MLKIKIEARVKCKRHPKYDPATQGNAGIVGGCAACGALLDLYDASLIFQRVTAGRVRDFDDQGTLDPCGRYLCGDGSGFGDGSGYGFGFGCGDGCGFGDGSGYGDGYWLWVFRSALSGWPDSARERLAELEMTASAIAFWRSDEEGFPANGGRRKDAEAARAGLVQAVGGPLALCTAGALHATMDPGKWKGKRLWVVALFGEIARAGDNLGAPHREIIGEVSKRTWADPAARQRMSEMTEAIKRAWADRAVRQRRSEA